jgi:hypothetical protein
VKFEAEVLCSPFHVLYFLTVLIYKSGSTEEIWKAGVELLCQRLKAIVGSLQK